MDLIYKKKNLILQIFIVFFLSIVFFRGRIGSDDLEVFNLVYHFKNFDGNLFNFLFFLKNTNNYLLTLDNTQIHSYYTWHHRIIWVIQTYIIYSLVDALNYFYLIKGYFFHQYFSGFILTFYTVCSYFILINFFIKKKINIKNSFILSTFIFFSTGIITFFTGQYIESLVIFLILLRLYYVKKKLSFLFDFIIVVIKPFYFFIVLALLAENINFKKNLIKNNLNNIFYASLIALSFILFRTIITDLKSNLSYTTSQSPRLELIFYLENIKNLYFSPSTGIITCAIVPFILIIFGFKKSTFFKLFPVLFFSLVISLYDGNHGGISGNRYFLPFLFVFIPEYILGYKKIVEFKKTKIFIFLVLMSALNFSALEYRNLLLLEYKHKTILTFKPLGPVEIKKQNDKNELKLRHLPLEKFYFNNIIFSNIISYSKLFNKDNINFKIINLDTKYIFPQSGLLRLIYIGNNELYTGNNLVNDIAKKYTLYFKFTYFFVTIIFLALYFNLALTIIKNGRN